MSGRGYAVNGNRWYGYLLLNAGLLALLGIGPGFVRHASASAVLQEADFLAEQQAIAQHLETVCRPLVTIQRAAAREGRITWVEDRGSDEACITLQPSASIASLRVAASSISSLASSTAGSWLQGQFLDAATRYALSLEEAQRTRCFKPLSHARKVRQRLDREADDAYDSAVSVVRKFSSSAWPRIQERVNLLDEQPKGSNEFEVARQSNARRISQGLSYCKTNLPLS